MVVVFSQVEARATAKYPAMHKTAPQERTIQLKAQSVLNLYFQTLPRGELDTQTTLTTTGTLFTQVFPYPMQHKKFKEAGKDLWLTKFGSAGTNLQRLCHINMHGQSP